jgi:hypothetical protein
LLLQGEKMATQNTINVGINISDNGTAKKTIKNVEALNAAIKSTQATQQAGTPMPATVLPGTAGSRKASNSAELTAYGMQRAGGAGTGASARDFAQQAQGLGGIVHLYATYAANLFAVGAAYTALSKAQDTANMVKGLDQLGAASGVALGSLSKDLVKAMDGAVSLREAMEATVKASSSGMVSKDILRMGEVAKKASQALGVDMSDALSRVSRGITKLEPELLDELGIFTRLDPAVREYANSVNKAVSEITDFERRMAFANAVLTEGEQKFGEINIQTNAYTRLLAVLKDTATEVGNSLNTILVPIASLFASSPVALTMAISALSAMLIKQAIPALGQFKQGILEASEESNLKAIQKIQDNALSHRVKSLGVLKKAEEDFADAKVAAHDKAEQAIQARQDLQSKTTPTGRLAKIDPQVRAMLDGKTAAVDYSPAQLAHLDSLAQKNGKYAESYKALASSIRESQEAEIRATKTSDEYAAALAAANEKRSVWTTIGRNQRAASEAAMQALRQETVANISNTASINGMRAAFTELGNSIRNQRAQGENLSKTFQELDAQGQATGKTITQKTGALGTFGVAALALSGTLGILGTVVQGVGATLQSALGWIGLVLGAGALFNAWASTATKELEEFQNATERSSEASKNLADQISRTYRISGAELFSYKTAEAQATSIINIADSLEAVALSAKEAKEAVASSFYESTINALKSIAGKDVASKEIAAYSKSIKDLVKLADKSAFSMSKFSNVLAESFGIRNVQSVKELEKALSSLSSEDREKFVKLLREQGVETGNLASRNKELQEVLKASSEAFQAFQNSFVDSSPLTLYAEQALSGLTKLETSLRTEGLVENFENLAKLSEEARKNPLFNSEDSLRVSAYSDAIKDVQEKLTALRAEREKLAAEKPMKMSLWENITSSKDSMQQRVEAQKAKTRRTAEIDQETKQLISAGTVISSAIGNTLGDAFDRGRKILSDSIALTLAKGATLFAEGVLSAFSGPSAVAGSESARLKNQELGIESQMLVTQKSLLLEAKRTNYLLEAAEAGRAYSSLPKEDREGLKGQHLLARQRLADAAAAGLNTSGKASQSAVATEASKLSDEGVDVTAQAKYIALDLEQFNRSLAGVDAQLNRLGQTMSLNTLNGKLEDIRGAYERESESRKDILSGVNQQILDVETSSAADPQFALEYESAKLTLQTKKDILEIDEKQYALAAKAKALVVGVKSGRLSKTRVDELVQDLLNERTGIDREQDERASKRLAERIEHEKNLIKQAKDIQEIEINTAKVVQDSIDAQTSSKRELRSLDLQAKEVSGMYDASPELLALEALENRRVALAEESAVKIREIKEAAAAADRDSLEKARTSSSTVQLMLTEQSAARWDAEKAAITNADVLLAKKLELVAVEEEALRYITLQNQLLSNMSSIADSLGEAFGKVGESLGGVVNALANIAKQEADSARQKKKLEDAIDKGTDTKQQAKDMSALAKLDAKSTKDRLKGEASLLKASKSVFSEKTSAYKALDALEKVKHIQIMYNMGVELAATLSSALKSAVGLTPAVMMKFLADLGPWGMAAGAAAIAAVLGGGGGSKATFIPSAEQRQETQGTAMSWDAKGNKIQTTRGVFGDTDAKSESIANSLERIKETSVDGLRYDNEVVSLLSKINDGINNTAKGIYSITGLRTGSMFGTKEGVTRGKGISSGLGLLGLGGGALSGLFGSKTTKNITDSGLLINATFSELADDTSNAVIQFYEDVTTTKKKWYGSSKTSYSKNISAADEVTAEYFNSIFSNATDLFVTLGKDAGVHAAEVLSSLGAVSFKDLNVSLRGLKGEELEKELSAIIGSMLDQGAEAVFSQFKQFAEFGEGLLETVVRVTDADKKVKQALANLGITSLSGATGMASFALTDTLVKAAGGIQDFLSKAEFYRENFLNEAERLAPIQLEVSTELAKLAKVGFTSADGLVDTRKEFKELVSSLDLTTESGQQAYTTLMEISEGFHTITEVAEAALKATIDKFKQFSDSLKTFRDTLVLGSSSTLTPMQKYLEAKSQFESTSAKALAGDVDAQSKFSGIAQTFLTASRDYNASSAQYSSDFNSVLDKIALGITEADAQISIAEKQLNVSNTQVGLLTTIDQNIATLVSGVPKLATGGLGHGLTTVGERGTELVDFTNPGRVYTAEQTRGMFAPQQGISGNMYQVVAELRQVKQELAQLRKEQHQQTGALITSNYDANNRTATAITEEVANTATQKEWQQRNKVAVV